MGQSQSCYKFAPHCAPLAIPAHLPFPRAPTKKENKKRKEPCLASLLLVTRRPSTCIMLHDFRFPNRKVDSKVQEQRPNNPTEDGCTVSSDALSVFLTRGLKLKDTYQTWKLDTSSSSKEPRSTSPLGQESQHACNLQLSNEASSRCSLQSRLNLHVPSLPMHQPVCATPDLDG